MRNTSKGSALILVQSYKNKKILLVRESESSDKTPPFPWKFPAGKVKFCKGETYIEAAQRELKEETGLEIDLGQLTLLGYKKTEKHILAIFGAYVDSFKGVAKKGETGEITRICRLKEIKYLIKTNEFLFNHHELLKHWGNDERLDLSHW